LAARTMMHAQPAVWADLMGWLAEVTGTFLHAQVSAGASAAQLFDSWAGTLSRADYTRHVAPYSRAALAPVRQLRIADRPVPTVRAAGWAVLREDAQQVVTAGRAAPAHVVSPGHGGPAETAPEVLTRLTAWLQGR